MDRDRHGVTDRPLIPHVLTSHVPPEMELECVLLLELDWVLEREEDGEPREHSGAMGGGEDGDHNVLVEVTLEVAAESVEDRVSSDVEAELGVPGVVDDLGVVGMLKCEQSLWRGELEPILQVICKITIRPFNVKPGPQTL